ncbi:MAG: MogA/MoaB family molybdenum cofactor biosynthesis protein [Tepidisphaeraceae bacterium]|jgi:molybdenum cofactor synthesis domain-containing protein
MKPITAAVLTCSDRCSRGQAVDKSGPALVEILQKQLSVEVLTTAILPDEAEQISRQIRAWALDSPKPDLILTTGGTGLSPRDVTPEATAKLLERRHPGLLELARLRCFAKTPKAFLSRGEAGTLGKTLIVNLPGSPRGASEFLQAMADILPHAIDTIRGEAVEEQS